MVSYFAIGKFRRIEEGCFRTYPEPLVHPSRTFPTFHDLVYLLEGGWSVSVGGENFELLPGDVIVLPAGTAHRGLGPCMPGTKTFFLHVCPVVGDTIDGEPPRGDGIARLPLTTLIHCQGNDMIRELFDAIAAYRAADTPARDEAISAILQTLITFLNQACRTVTKNQELIASALSVMKAFPSRFFTEQDMADRLFVSPKTLRALFKNRFGKTFYQYQLDTKLSQVCVCLIETPDRCLRVVADELGFADEFHLSKAFKRRYGLSPAAYRRSAAGTALPARSR